MLSPLSDDNNGRAAALLGHPAIRDSFVMGALDLPDRQPYSGDPDAARYSKWEFVISRVRDGNIAVELSECEFLTIPECSATHFCPLEDG
jgi:hypothetical protein